MIRNYILQNKRKNRQLPKLPTTTTTTIATTVMTAIGSAIAAATTTTTASIIQSPESLFQKVCQGFTSLRGSPKELWSAYILKFLDSYSYFAFSLIFTLFLSDDFGYSDVAAGTIYGLWGALVTVYGLLAGCIMDNLGVARSL
jgi:nitrate/nitrite transporter NarK